VRTNKGINTLKVETIAEDKVVGLLFQDLKSVSGVDSVAYTGRILPVNDWVSDELEEEGA
jgi:hypothetical protein